MDELKVSCGDVTFTYRPIYGTWIANGIKLTTNELIEKFIIYNISRLDNESCPTQSEE